MINADASERLYTENILRLEIVNSKLNIALDQIPSLLSFCQLTTGKEYVTNEIYAAASERIALLIPFEVCAFLEMTGPGTDLEVTYINCSRQEISLSVEMERLVEEKIIDWVAERRLPVIIESKQKDKNLILHALTTATGVRGLFVAVLVSNVEQIADCDLSLLSILLYNIASSIEMLELEVDGKQKNINQENRGKLGLNSKDSTIITNNPLSCYDKLNNSEHYGQNLPGCEAGSLDHNGSVFSKNNMPFDSKIIINEKINSFSKLSNCFNELKNPINFIRINLDYLKKYILDIEKFINHRNIHDSECYGFLYNPYSSNEINSNFIGLLDDSTRDDLNGIFLESDIGLRKIDNFISSVGKFYNKCEQDAPVIIDINNLVEETLTFTKNIFQGDVKFVTNFGNLPLLLGYPLLLKDVFLTLFQRSIVAFDNQFRSAPSLIVIKTWVDKQKIWCTINDNGFWGDKDDRMPGGNFSTHSLTDDWHLTNASIAIVQDVIINKHKGDVSIAYGEGNGSIITIQLPVWYCDNESSDFSLV